MSALSNWPAYKLARAVGRTEVKNLTRIASVQPRYNLLFRSFERDLLPLCREENIAVIPFNPLAGGLLTGKHKPGAAPDSGRFTLGTAGAMYQTRYWHDREFETSRLSAASGERGGAEHDHAGGGLDAGEPCDHRAHHRRQQTPNSSPTISPPSRRRCPPISRKKLDELTHAWRAVDAER